MAKQKDQISSLTPFIVPKRFFSLPLRSSSFHGEYQLPVKYATKSFELSRSYQPGDPIRFIDWNYYARSDKLIPIWVRGSTLRAAADRVFYSASASSRICPKM